MTRLEQDHSCYCRENGSQGGRSRHINTTEEALAEIQARDEVVLDQGDKRRGGEKRLNSGYIFKVQSVTLCNSKSGTDIH